MPRKLKVFRTPAGFHDAYVAAPSRKAALAAWGASADLFARGIAEEVTDPALMEAPLAAPGEIVRRSRGSAEEQLAAAPRSRDRSRKQPATRTPARAPERPPRPDRVALTAAEAALEAATRTHRAERKALADRQKALEREQRALLRRQEEEQARLERARAAAARAYDAALAAWGD